MGPNKDPIERQIIPVKMDGLTAWCDGLRISKEIVFMSVFGHRNAVRAVWARLSGKRNGLHVGDIWCRLAEGVQYATIAKPIGHQEHHMILLAPEASNRVSPFDTKFALVTPTPERDWFSRFNRMCPVPVRREWAPLLWQLGREQIVTEEEGTTAPDDKTTVTTRKVTRTAGPIQPMMGHGMPGYVVDCTADSWLAVIRAGIRDGRLR